MAAVHKIDSQTKYSRRHPEEGLLYRIVEAYWPLFLREQERVGRNIPIFIKDEFSKYLQCGMPEFGFIRTYCHQCRDSSVVAFSCKKRGFCPSCCAKRMNDEAAHIVDKVFADITIRQWVISFPYELRFQMAHNSKLTSKVLAIFTKTITKYQKKKAKKQGIANAKVGGVTFIQRFGSALNLNVHFHTLFADGVFYKQTDNTYYFLRLAQPTKSELETLVRKIQSKVQKLIDQQDLLDHKQESFDEDSLGKLSELSIRHKSGFGDRKDQGLRRYGTRKIEVDSENKDTRSASYLGFSLNASVWISGKQKSKLEKLIRYVARGPIATERLSECYPNKLIYKMKTHWHDGTTHVSFSYLDFIARLVALIPPPRMNLIRYHGVYAPNSKDRSLIVPKRISKPTSAGSTIGSENESKVRRTRLSWSEMLKRVFKIDVTVCNKCGGRVEQIAVIKDRVVAKAIIESLRQVTVFNPLQVVFERGPPESLEHSEFDFDQRGSW